MFIGIIIGVLGGLAATRWMAYRGGFGRGRCGGREGGGHWRRHGHWRGGGRGPGQYWRLFRELDLSPGQRGAVRDLFDEMRDTMREARHGVRSEIDPLLEALAAESFDRARIDEVAGRQTAAFDKIKKQLVDASERLHAILIPEQRARLREVLGQWGAPGDAGPYRTA